MPVFSRAATSAILQDTSERRPLPSQYFFELIEGDVTQQRDAIALLAKSNSITYKAVKGVHAFLEANDVGKEVFYAMMPIHTEKGLLAVEPQVVEKIGAYEGHEEIWAKRLEEHLMLEHQQVRNLQEKEDCPPELSSIEYTNLRHIPFILLGDTPSVSYR